MYLIAENLFGTEALTTTLNTLDCLSAFASSYRTGQEEKRVLMGSVPVSAQGRGLDGQVVTTADWKVLSDNH